MASTPTDGQNLITMGSVYLSPHVLGRIKRGALLYPHEETGEALVGVADAPEKGATFPTMYILETIPPVQDAVREWGMFSQGDDWQASIFNWLNANWELYRQMRRRSYGESNKARWDMPLQHLGDWHKQPGGMIHPSGGDFRTARFFMRDNDMKYLLTPIVTFADECSDPAEANTLILTDVQPAVRVDFWGLGRRDRNFVPLRPVTTLGYGMPRLPETVWWLHDSRRMDLEIAALEKDGLTVMDIVQYNVDGIPPLETCFAVYRPGGQQVIIAVTPYNYPHKPPQWRVAPLQRPDAGAAEADMFKLLMAASQPVQAAVVAEWNSQTHALLDGVRLIEKGLGGL